MGPRGLGPWGRGGAALLMLLVLGCCAPGAPASGARSLLAGAQQQQQQQQQQAVSRAEALWQHQAEHSAASHEAHQAAVTAAAAKPRPGDDPVMQLFEALTQDPSPDLPDQTAISRRFPPTDAATMAPLGAVMPLCRTLAVETGCKVAPNPRTGGLLLTGTVKVTNSGPSVAALDRVGVRLCSRDANHLRVRATCPTAGDYDEPGTADVAAGATIVCTWEMELPAPGEPGAALTDYTGVFSAVLAALYGDRCPSPVVDPVTGAVSGTCTANDA